MSNLELSQERLEIREQNRQRMMDIIARRVIIEVVEPHTNIYVRLQKEQDE